MKRRDLLTYAGAAAAGLAAPNAFAQAAGYPARPVRLVVPFAAGISPDVVARLIADRLGAAIGQPVVVDNRPGAGGMIGAVAAATTPADGYTLFFSVKATHAIAPNVYRDPKYNPPRDFKAVSQILQVPHVLTATPKAPYNTMRELVEFAKKNPGKIDFASLGVGSQPHVAMEVWAQRLGIKLNHVPYKSNPSADVISGLISLSVEASTTAIPLIKAGRVKALGISGAQRIPSLPDVPTMTEFEANLDLNGVIGSSWHGIFAPTGTPNDIIAKLNTEIVKIVRMPDVQARLTELGLTPTGTTAAALDAVANSDYAFWNQVVRELDIKAE